MSEKHKLGTRLVVWELCCVHLTLATIELEVQGMYQKGHSPWNPVNGHYCEFPFGDVGPKVLSGYGHRQETVV
jgi:hypothetical protein